MISLTYIRSEGDFIDIQIFLIILCAKYLKVTIKSLIINAKLVKPIIYSKFINQSLFQYITQSDEYHSGSFGSSFF
jgi:hypothetical protein